MNILELTNDWLFLIFDLVDLETIGTLRRVCTRLYDITNLWVTKQKMCVYEKYVLECVKQHTRVIIQCPNFEGLDQCITRVYNSMLNQTYIVHFHDSIPKTPFLDEHFPAPSVFHNNGFWKWRIGDHDRNILIFKQHLTYGDLKYFLYQYNFKIDKLIVICTSIGSTQKIKIPIKTVPFLMCGNVFTKFKFNLYNVRDAYHLPNGIYRWTIIDGHLPKHGQQSNNVLIYKNFSYVRFREILSSFRYITQEPTTITFDICLRLKSSNPKKDVEFIKLKKNIKQFLQN